MAMTCKAFETDKGKIYIVFDAKISIFDVLAVLCDELTSEEADY